MQCKCGQDLPEGAKFCHSCGKPAPKPKNIPQVADELIIRQVDAYLTPVDAAGLLKISRWKLDELRMQKKLPDDCFIVLSGNKKKTIRYRARELLSWASSIEGPITTAG